MNDLSVALERMWREMNPAPVVPDPVAPTLNQTVAPVSSDRVIETVIVSGFSTRLVCQTAEHNKEYNLCIVRAVASDQRFHVRFSYGRIGGNLTHGEKTDNPVSFSEAKVIYYRVMKEKLDKGYKEV